MYVNIGNLIIFITFILLLSPGIRNYYVEYGNRNECDGGMYTVHYTHERTHKRSCNIYRVLFIVHRVPCTAVPMVGKCHYVIYYQFRQLNCRASVARIWNFNVKFFDTNSAVTMIHNNFRNNMYLQNIKSQKYNQQCHIQHTHLMPYQWRNCVQI